MIDELTARNMSLTELVSMLQFDHPCPIARLMARRTLDALEYTEFGDVELAQKSASLIDPGLPSCQ